MTSEATEPPERELTEALLSLSWPLPRTVGDAQSALDRLDQVRTVLSRLEQESVGTEAWWAGQVDALGTQSGFVLEWWLPVLRDPDLDWTLNHQAHLTADLATLASAGARLLDQLEPSADRRDELARGRRGGPPRRDWGPAAVPHPAVPGARPQPPAEVFGDLAAAPASTAPAAAPAAAAVEAGPGGLSEADTESSIPVFRPAPDARPDEAPESGVPDRESPRPEAPRSEAPRSDRPAERPPSAGELEAPAFPPLPGTPDSAASDLLAARHRRLSYDFDDPSAPPPPPPPAVFPPRTAPRATPRAAPGTPGASNAPGAPRGPRGPRAPRPPGAGFPGPPPGYAPVGLPPGYAPPTATRRDAEDDEDEQGRVVPTGLREHQHRLLVLSGLVLVAVGGLCWWAVQSLTDDQSHASAAGSTRSTAAAAPGTGAAGLTVPDSPSAATGGSSGAKPSSSPPSAPATATTKVPDATTATSVQATLLGGSGAVPQIVALVTVHTAGTGAISVTASYYGQKGGSRLAPESQTWTLTGKTAYQFTVPIANSPYCGGTFHLTLEAGGLSSATATSPGC